MTLKNHHQSHLSCTRCPKKIRLMFEEPKHLNFLAILKCRNFVPNSKNYRGNFVWRGQPFFEKSIIMKTWSLGWPSWTQFFSQLSLVQIEKLLTIVDFWGKFCIIEKHNWFCVIACKVLEWYPLLNRNGNRNWYWSLDLI